MVKKTSENAALESLNGWDTLEQTQQLTISQHTESGKKHLSDTRRSRLAFGADLAAVRPILMEKEMWTDYCRSIFHMSVATAFRYVKYYETTSKKLPQPLIDFAIQTGYEIPLKAVESSRPPKTEDPDEMTKYLERINVKEKKIIVIEHNPDSVLKDLLHEAELAYNRLPKHSRTRSNFINNLFGMLMTVFGIGHKQTFEPAAIPEHFKIVRGRPKKAA